MFAKTLFSETESKLLLGLILTIAFVFYINLGNKTIDDYNQKVLSEQTKKRIAADHPHKPTVSFGLYSCYSTPFWYLLYGLQFFTNPISFFLIRVKSIGSFIASFIFTFVTFYCFSMWLYQTFKYLTIEESLLHEEFSFNQWVLYQSTKLEFVVFLLISILLVIQTFILLRLVTERFQTKISLK